MFLGLNYIFINLIVPRMTGFAPEIWYNNPLRRDQQFSAQLDVHCDG
jgi:hypothetical protein